MTLSEWQAVRCPSGGRSEVTNTIITAAKSVRCIPAVARTTEWSNEH